MKWLSFLRAVLPFALPVALGAAIYLLVGMLERSAYEAGERAATTRGDLALVKLKNEHQAQELTRALAAEADAKAAAKNLLDEQARNDKLASDLAEQQRQHRQTTDRLSGEIARVNDLYREALDAPPKPLPACVFTTGFVRVWDEATGAAAPVPTSAGAGRTAAQVAAGQAVEQLDSGISQDALLGHHIQYAEQCRNTAAQLDALIDAVQQKDTQ